MVWWVVLMLIIVVALIGVGALIWSLYLKRQRKFKNYERGLKMMPMMIHLPPETEDINVGSRDERDVIDEQLSQAQVMYSILASTISKGFKSRVFGQRHFTFEIIAKDGLIKYYTVAPAVLTETIKQAVISAYPTARLEEIETENIFSEIGKIGGVTGGELTLKKDFIYPINTYEDKQNARRDATQAVLNAMSGTKQGEGLALQILLRPIDNSWVKRAKNEVEKIREGKSNNSGKFATGLAHFTQDAMNILWKPPSESAKEREQQEHTNPLTDFQQSEIAAIESKARFPAFETSIRLIASSTVKERSEAIVGGLVAAFAQFDSPQLNGFQYTVAHDPKKLATDYIFRFFAQDNTKTVLNSMELASIFHLPSQNVIPTSQVERQATKQVDAPAKLAKEGLFLGTNEFRGEKKKIFLTSEDRARHMYILGQTGMGKSVFLENLAHQDMKEGRGFAFLDPHGDAIEALLKRIPKDRIDDVILFDPTDIEHPVGMNMFEYDTPDQKDFIVQEGINILQSLFDPNNQGFFGPRGQQMFRNAALLLMADPDGATFIDVPQCFTDPEFVKSKLKYVTDKALFDYWTKEFPASQKSNEAGEVVAWFNSKWGPFISNTMMRNVLGQVKSSFNIREMMDNKKIFLVNLSKGGLGEVNSNLLGMILVMKFQTAAMSRQDIPENQREEFCLFVDEFQNFATESFESILSEARKYRLNLIVANQFMTQLSEKIREALLGNVGTIICGRIGITDAELMAKAFAPKFTAEDLTKTPNLEAICKEMIYGVPSSPFTLKMPHISLMGKPNDQLMNKMKDYTKMRFSKTRADVEREINERWSVAEKEKQLPPAPDPVPSTPQPQPQIDPEPDQPIKVAHAEDNDDTYIKLR